MKSILFSIGPLHIYGYGLMIATAIISAYMSAEYRAKKHGLQHELIYNLTIWCAIGGLLGAKLLFFVTEIPEIIKDPSLLLKVADGFVVFGGIITGILAGYLFCRKHKLNFLRYFDITMPSIALAQGFGRIGCFFAGCCYGKETTSKFALHFPEGSLAPSGVGLIPIQLISSGLDFLHFLVLVLIAKKNKVDGVIAGCYLMFYSVGRFIVELFRGDLDRGNVGSISTSQFISIFTFLLGLAIVIIRITYTRKNPVLENPVTEETFEAATKEETEEVNVK